MMIVDIVKELLIFKDTNVSVQNNDDFSALFCAAGHVDVVNELLNDNRTKVKVKDVDGFTAPIAVGKKNHYDVI